MSQMTNGEQNWTPERCINGYLAMLQEHLDGVSYPRLDPKATEFTLDVTVDDLRSMTIVELSELAYELANTSFAIQDEYNRQKSKAERCKTTIARLINGKLDHSIYGGDDKWMTAAFNNREARPFWEIRQQALTVCLRLEGQAMRLSEIVKVLNNLIYNRKSS